ncbi:dienelactone hydrolase family protein [Thermogutta sp.]|uniref:dienelactone hydrolase family protein n=1 Tax=Thermogutta sp. TaxID=1962930 RepID=UPI003C7AE675
MRSNRFEVASMFRARKPRFVSAIYGRLLVFGSLIGSGFVLGEPAQEAENVATALPGTAPLTIEGDLASQMIDAIDGFLDRETARTVARRDRVWREHVTSGQWPEEWITSRKARLAKILGVTDPRVPSPRLSILAPAGQDPVLASGPTYDIYAVRWDVFSDVTGEGLLVVPRTNRSPAAVIAVPDADVSPETLVGLTPGVASESQFARRLAESGCTVLIPQLIPREITKRRNVSLTHREYLYRPAYELGRHIIGYEVQKILAAVDYFAAQVDPGAKPTIAVMGWGEGGMLALYAAALDDRIATVAVSGFFGPREATWSEPVDRNVFSLLKDFGCAEISLLIHPRPVIVEAARGPEVTVPKGLGGAPGSLSTPKLEEVQSEVARANDLLKLAHLPSHLTLMTSGDGRGPYGSEAFLRTFLHTLNPNSNLSALAQGPQWRRENPWQSDRVQRQIDELDRHIQTFLEQSSDVRRQFWSRLDTSSLAKFTETVEWYRRYFYDEIIGRIDLALSAPNPRSRRVYEQPKWTGYEVVLDVFDGVFAYGILLVPKDIRPGERRPVVVCQHGLEGRPRDTIEGDHRAYHDFAARLAEQGFVVFAPQNPYIFGDRFRTLQRKANPIGKTLFSVIVPQHQQIVNWLSSLDFVDPTRIAFYGLSYGGKTAMRVPPLVPQYCLSICSADFNDWVWKNASTRSNYSYVFTGEYEIFEFDLGETFNYAEMATLIAPRPFMVERGHFDGVAPDERVAYEYAKVRFLYEALLGLTEKTEIEWFVGPHTIHGVGTFKFLHRHLGF